MKKKILIFSKQTDRATQAAKQLEEWVNQKGIQTIDVSKSTGLISATEMKEVCLGVVFGGDGTFLTLVRRLEKKDIFPIIGVNLGSLGFITEFDVTEMLEIVSDCLEGKYKEEHHKLLEVQLFRKEKKIESGHVFNDAVINKDARTSMLKFEVSLNGDFLTFVRADGYIISTPTGSTAYCLSVGGPLLHPSVNAVVLLPICAHSLSARPIVIPRDLSITITMKEFQGDAYLVFDGQVNYEIESEDRIEIAVSDKILRLIQAPKKNWSQTLRSKLQMA